MLPNRSFINEKVLTSYSLFYSLLSMIDKTVTQI